MELEEREALHRLYLALFQARKSARDMFSDGECTRIMTAIMAAKVFSWRVVGITPQALVEFEATDFRYVSGKGLTRAHLIPRIDTVRLLLDQETPLEIEAFFEIWLANDRTVICSRGENTAQVPEYIPIENPEGRYFSCHRKLAGWHHRGPERDLLRALANRIDRSDS